MGKHYVPQQYLRAFKNAARQPAIWMFDKQTRIWSNAAIKRVAQETDYFPPDVERQLTDLVEGPGHRALALLRANLLITPRQRDDLAIYIAVLLMRVPRKRRRGYELVPEVMKDTFAEMREEITLLRDGTNGERVEQLLREVAEIEAKYRDALPERVKNQIESPWPSDEVLRAIRGMTWRILRAQPPHFFITTDNPAFYFESLGVGREESELTFPISPSVAIVGSFQPGPSQMFQRVADPAIVEEVNRRIIAGAERFVFSDRKEFWVEALALDGALDLNRIRW